jgi:4-amino-4-deoxy-L-arabinose transferase-like glycosyltransferase
MGGLLITPTAWSIKAVFTSITGSIVSAAPSGNSGMGGSSSTTQGISQTWLTFVGNNLSGQLYLVGAIVGAGAALLGLRYLLRKRHVLNLPVLSAILLAFFLLGSTGWWVNAAQAQTTSQTSANRFGTPGGNAGGGMGGGEQTDQSLITYLETNQGDYEYLVAVSSSNTAAPIIIQTGKPVMSLGGFLGSAKIVTTTEQVKQLIDNHTVRYFMLGGNQGGGQNSVVTQYVQQNCKVVDSSAYSTSTSTSAATASSTSGSGNQPGGSSSQQQLYVCGS